MCLYRLAALLTVLVVAPVARADDPSDAEAAKLRARIRALEAENAALKAEVTRLKHQAKVTAAEADAAHQAGLRRLLELERALAETPDAADLAARLAPDLPGNRLVWR